MVFYKVWRKLRNILLFVLSFGSLYSQENIINQGQLLTPAVTHEIKYFNTKKEIVDHVVLKNERHKFIFDTGAPLCISKEIQAKNSYDILHKVPMRDATNRVDTVIIVEVDTFAFGNIKILNIPALVVDFKNSPIGCQGIEGIIGSNIARFFIVRFDVLSNKVILTNDSEKIREFPTQDFKPVFLDFQSNAFFEIGFGGGFKDTVHFDSGKSSYYDMNFEIAKSLIETEKPKHYKGRGFAGQGVFGTGEIENLFRILSPISLSNVLLDKVIIESTQAKSRIGREVLNYGTLTIDYINSQYSFVKYPKTFYQTKPFYGFDIIAENNKLIASVVWENTVASQKGIHSGDEIISVNGKRFNNLNSCEIESILTKELEKSKIRISFLNNGKERSIKLKSID